MTKSLDNINKRVIDFYKENKSENWKLNYHIEAPFGLLNDPNGLAYFNGEYYIFYQWNPFGCQHKSKHWALTKTKDFIKYTIPKAVLEPVDWYDKDGCYSGSALEVNGKLEVIYTGNVKDENNNRSSYQCRLSIDKKGNINKIGPIVDTIPKGYTADFRDPKVFENNGEYYFIIGVKNEESLGRVLLYKSADFNEWNLLGEIKTSYNDFGYMWECPNLFKLEGMDILLFSPQGLEKEEFKYQNIYQSGYILGALDYSNLEFNHNKFTEIDLGTDFYAPQVFKDLKGRTIMYGWMGLPEEEDFQPTNELGWVYSLTMPRELTLKDGILYQRPIYEMKDLRVDEIEEDNNITTNMWTCNNIKTNSYELILDIDNLNSDFLELRFAEGNDDYSLLKFDFRKNIGILDNTNRANGPKQIRKFRLKNETKYKINMFVDNSSAEIFLQEGREVLSTRIYPNEGSTGLSIKAINGDFKINELKVYSLGGIKYVK